MKNIFKTLITLFFLLNVTSAFATAVEGKDYTLLQPERPVNGDKIEVLEFFFYECSHCYDLHPLLDQWKKNKPDDVELTYVPTMFRDSTEPLARTFYALKSMDKLDGLNNAIYEAIHQKNQHFRDLSSIADFVASHGVDQDKFKATYKSFAVSSKIRRAKQMIRDYQIMGTPTLVVNGKYVITGKRPAQTIEALKKVIDKARTDQ